jgi:hypothetical protein
MKPTNAWKALWRETYALRLRVRRARELRRIRRREWIRIGATPPEPEPLESFLLFAIVGTWFEGDVIASTVKNALTQGCDEVYLVDNGSPDDTVAEAVAAGAILTRRYYTEFHDEPLRVRTMHEVMKERSERAGAPHIWWLWLDADEFPEGPDGMTIRQYLATLDRRFRIVGSRAFNHYPHEEPAMLRGFHPLDFQPLCEAHEVPHCPLLHWKHQLHRHDRDGPPIRPLDGFHWAACAQPLIEPAKGIVLHHFPYRAESDTRKRLEAFCLPRNDSPSRLWLDDRVLGESNARRRFRSLDHVYRGRWDLVRSRCVSSKVGVKLAPWQKVTGSHADAAPRWYSKTQLAEALAAARPPPASRASVE